MSYEIENIEEITFISVTMANGAEFRRSKTCVNWEQLMGGSWEPCYLSESELESAYQEYLLSDRS